MKVSFWYVRHGKTVFNEAGRMQGQCDSPLNEEGTACMQKTAEALKEIPFAHAYSSPLGRCVQSSEILMQYHADTRLDFEEDLKEMSFGDLDGQSFAENRDLINKCLKEKSFACVQGESDQDVIERCDRCFRRIVQASSDGDNILIVSHGAYLRRLFSSLFQMPVLSHDIHIPNGSITPFVYENENYRLLSLPLTPDEFRKGIIK